MRSVCSAALARSALISAALGSTCVSGLSPRRNGEKARPATLPVKSGTGTGRSASAHSPKAIPAASRTASSVVGWASPRRVGKGDLASRKGRPAPRSIIVIPIVRCRNGSRDAIKHPLGQAPVRSVAKSRHATEQIAVEAMVDQRCRVAASPLWWRYRRVTDPVDGAERPPPHGTRLRTRRGASADRAERHVLDERAGSRLVQPRAPRGDGAAEREGRRQGAAAGRGPATLPAGVAGRHHAGQRARPVSSVARASRRHLQRRGWSGFPNVGPAIEESLALVPGGASSPPT